MATDGRGNIYISGTTDGALGAANAGRDDVFLAKYSAAGDLLWIRQFGTAGIDFCGGVAVDAQGDLYICGSTYGDLGGVSLGEADAFVGKCDGEGNLLWLRQLGTPSWP